MADKAKTVWATKPFWWNNKNVNKGDKIKLSGYDLAWMLERGAVSETEVKPDPKPKAVSKAK